MKRGCELEIKENEGALPLNKRQVLECKDVIVHGPGHCAPIKVPEAKVKTIPRLLDHLQFNDAASIQEPYLTLEPPKPMSSELWDMLWATILGNEPKKDAVFWDSMYQGTRADDAAFAMWSYVMQDKELPDSLLVFCAAIPEVILYNVLEKNFSNLYIDFATSAATLFSSPHFYHHCEHEARKQDMFRKLLESYVHCRKNESQNVLGDLNQAALLVQCHRGRFSKPQPPPCTFSESLTQFCSALPQAVEKTLWTSLSIPAFPKDVAPLVVTGERVDALLQPLLQAHFGLPVTKAVSVPEKTPLRLSIPKISHKVIREGLLNQLFPAIDDWDVALGLDGMRYTSPSLPFPVIFEHEYGRKQASLHQHNTIQFQAASPAIFGLNLFSVLGLLCNVTAHFDDALQEASLTEKACFPSMESLYDGARQVPEPWRLPYENFYVLPELTEKMWSLKQMRIGDMPLNTYGILPTISPMFVPNIKMRHAGAFQVFEDQKTEFYEAFTKLQKSMMMKQGTWLRDSMPRELFSQIPCYATSYNLGLLSAVQCGATTKEFCINWHEVQHNLKSVIDVILVPVMHVGELRNFVKPIHFSIMYLAKVKTYREICGEMDEENADQDTMDTEDVFAMELDADEASWVSRADYM